MMDLRIAYTDFWPEWSIENFISPILSEKYNLIEDYKNPDIVFHSIFNRMRETPKYKCKKVLILAENWRADRFGSDYSISFDPHSDTNFRLPLWQIYLLLWPELKNHLYNRTRHLEFDRFCSFSVSNPSNRLRIAHFDRLSEYKKVSSYGKVRTNDLSLYKRSIGKYWRDAKIQFFTGTPHKFGMAYENTSYPYYCTEKLMDQFLVGSLPIYWGDPKVIRDWNPQAFLNITGKSRWADLVKKLDEDDNLYEDLYSQPVFTDEQKSRHEENLSSFSHWLTETVNV